MRRAGCEKRAPRPAEIIWKKCTRKSWKDEHGTCEVFRFFRVLRLKTIYLTLINVKFQLSLWNVEMKYQCCFQQHHFKFEWIFKLECKIHSFKIKKIKVGANQSEICLFSKIEATKCVSRTVIQSRNSDWFASAPDFTDFLYWIFLSLSHVWRIISVV